MYVSVCLSACLSVYRDLQHTKIFLYDSNTMQRTLFTLSPIPRYLALGRGKLESAEIHHWLPLQEIWLGFSESSPR